MTAEKAIRRLVRTVNTRIAFGEPIPGSELEALYQALGEHLGRPTRCMTTEEHTRLWDAINAYAMSVGGNPATHVYGNVRRMTMVSRVEDVMRSLKVGWRQFETPELTHVSRAVAEDYPDAMPGGGLREPKTVRQMLLAKLGLITFDATGALVVGDWLALAPEGMRGALLSLCEDAVGRIHRRKITPNTLGAVRAFIEATLSGGTWMREFERPSLDDRVPVDYHIDEHGEVSCAKCDVVFDPREGIHLCERPES